MYHLRDISEDTALFPWNKSTPYPALESSVAVGVSLLAGHVSGYQSAGSIAAGAAFTAGFAVFHEAMASTLLSMGVLTCGIATATLIGSLGAQWTAVVLLLCVVASVNYGLLAGIGNTTGWIGQQCAVFVIVSSYFGQGLHYAVGRTAMVLFGGALQMLCFALFTSLRRYGHRSDPSPPHLTRQLRTRSGQLTRAFLGELRWDAATTGYVLRLAVTLGLSTMLYRHLHLRNGYWAPMTAMLVLKPEWANTLSRGVARLSGTLVGASLCFVIALTPLPKSWIYFTLILLTAWACYTLQAVNYAAFSAAMTMYTVFLFGYGGFSERSAAGIRLTNTAFGGALALLVDFVARKLGPRLLTRYTRGAPTPALQ